MKYENEFAGITALFRLICIAALLLLLGGLVYSDTLTVYFPQIHLPEFPPSALSQALSESEDVSFERLDIPLEWLAVGAVVLLALILIGMIVYISAKAKDDTGKMTAVKAGALMCLSFLAKTVFLLLLLPWKVENLIFVEDVINVDLFPVLYRNVVYLCLVACAALFLNRRRLSCGKSLLLLVLLVNSVYYFSPDWTMYGVSSSTREYMAEQSTDTLLPPAYPRFIEDTLVSTSVVNLSYWRSDEGVRLIDQFADSGLSDDTRNDSRGLIRIVHVQKIIAGISFFIMVCMLLSGIPAYWLLIFTQVVFQYNLLGVQPSVIVPDTLIQSVIMLSFGLFAYFVFTGHHWAFFFYCAVLALAIMLDLRMVFLLIPALVFILLMFSRGAIRAIAPLICGALMFGLLIFTTYPVIGDALQSGIFSVEGGTVGLLRSMLIRLRYAAEQNTTRIPVQIYWILIGVSAVVAFVRINAYSVTGLFFILMHIAAVASGVFITQSPAHDPSTEIVMLSGIMIVTANLLFDLKKMRSYGRTASTD